MPLQPIDGQGNETFRHLLLIIPGDNQSSYHPINISQFFRYKLRRYQI